MQLIFGLILTLLATPALIWVAHNYGLLDYPDERKQHQGATPLVGGLAMSIAMAVSAAFYFEGTTIFWGLFASLAIIVAVGVLDDWGGLPVGFRFLAQGLAASIVALFAGAQLTSLGDLFGLGFVSLGVFAVPFTVFAVVGVANALNLSDGMDGLAGGLALIATAFLAAAAHLAGKDKAFIVLLILGGALIGFLCFNMRLPWQRRAKVFMGDCGSLMLGFILAWAAIRISQAERDALPPAAALWFFAIPLWDTVRLLFLRKLKGRSPFQPSCDHLHHLLLRVGYSDSQVVRFIHLVAIASGLVGFVGWRAGIPDAAMFYAFLAAFALYCAAVQRPWILMRLVVPANAH